MKQTFAQVLLIFQIFINWILIVRESFHFHCTIYECAEKFECLDDVVIAVKLILWQAASSTRKLSKTRVHCLRWKFIRIGVHSSNSVSSINDVLPTWVNDHCSVKLALKRLTYLEVGLVQRRIALLLIREHEFSRQQSKNHRTEYTPLLQHPEEPSTSPRGPLVNCKLSLNVEQSPISVLQALWRSFNKNAETVDTVCFDYSPNDSQLSPVDF